MSSNIWYSSLYIFIDKITWVIFYVCAAFSFAVADSYFGLSAGASVPVTFIIVATLAIPVHFAILLSGDDAALAKRFQVVLSPFFWRSMVLSLVGIMPAFLSAIAVVVAGAPKGLEIISFLIVWMISGPAAFAKWGTMLPAVVMGDDPKFGTAGQRGSKVFGYAFPRLLVSLVLLTALMLGLAIFATYALGLDAEGPAAYAVILITGPLGAYQVIMTSLILSRSYKISGAQMHRA